MKSTKTKQTHFAEKIQLWLDLILFSLPFSLKGLVYRDERENGEASSKAGIS